MAQNDLTITLKAVDEASEPIRTALNGIKMDTENVKKAADDAGKTIQQQFREAGKEVHEFRKTLFLATAALGVIISTTREASKYNADAKLSFDRFTTSISSLASTIGTALYPIINGVTAIINVLRDSIEAVIAGFIKFFSLIVEGFGALQEGIKNVVDNIKNIFTGKEDPMGIVEGFRVSFQKAMDIANAASDEFLNKVETTRALADTGNTLDVTKKQTENLKVASEKAADKTKQGWESSKKSVNDFGSALKGAEVLGKGFAKAAAAVSIGMAIINTAQGITAALAGPPTGPPWPANLAMAALVGATGALQIATIAATSFAVGTPNVPNDMMAQIHKGETIIPATFADAIRRGDLALSGGGGAGGSGDITINLYGVTVNSKENVKELAEQLGFEIDRNIRNARTRV